MRLPRRAEAEVLLANEARWLPTLARTIALPVPEPVRFIERSDLVGGPFAIVRWCAGRPLDLDGSRLGAEGAGPLGVALLALREPAPAEAPANPYRGVPLEQRDARVRAGLDLLPRRTADRLRARWTDALTAAPWAGSGRWIHGDLHPGNLLVDGSDLTAIIDWGDLASGDPATDLSVAWTACDASGRRRLREIVRPSEDEWARAQGNALAHGVACVSALRDDPRVGGIGWATLTEVLES